MFGSIGGFIFGLFLAMGLLPQKSDNRNQLQSRKEKIIYVFSIITVVILYILFIVLFFAQKKAPTKYWYFTDSDAVNQSVNMTKINDPSIGPFI